MASPFDLLGCDCVSYTLLDGYRPVIIQSVQVISLNHQRRGRGNIKSINLSLAYVA